MEEKDIKNRMIEAYVSDAMLQKPIEFTLNLYREKAYRDKR